MRAIGFTVHRRAVKPITSYKSRNMSVVCVVTAVQRHAYCGESLLMPSMYYLCSAFPHSPEPSEQISVSECLEHSAA